MILKSFIAILFLCFASIGFAEEETGPIVDDAYGDAFTHYQPYVNRKKPVDPKKAEAPVAAPAPSAKPKEEKVTVEWLRKNYVVLQERSINDPTKENVEAEAYARRIIFDKSQNYAEALVKVTQEDVFLNENNRVPYASAGATAIRNANIRAQEQAVKELASVGGLLVFVDSTCRFCALQLPVISALQNSYNMSALVISIDGSAPKGYTGTIVKDNGMFKKLGLKLTPSIVYVPKPKSYTEAKDNNQYYIVSQGFYALDELVKMIGYAGYKTNLLSENTRKDLDIWNRGVADAKDLNSLTLDVNDPKSFKNKIVPLLEKKY